MEITQIGLWLAALLVTAFALSPYYIGPLAARLASHGSASVPPTTSAQKSQAADQVETARATFVVEGMTCTGCATTLRLALEHTPGVHRAEVSYKNVEAIVDYDPKLTAPDKLPAAIDETGYKAKAVK